MEKLCKRDSRLDLIRIFSLFCVAGIHFFLNSGFYSQMVSGKRMFIMCIFRSFFIICVPMFITLTGYLMNKKTPKPEGCEDLKADCDGCKDYACTNNPAHNQVKGE
mgnify:CR=1 FL=1